jgi:hypothetical protein
VRSNELDLHNNKVVELLEYSSTGSDGDIELLYEDFRYVVVQKCGRFLFLSKDESDSHAQFFLWKL